MPGVRRYPIVFALLLAGCSADAVRPTDPTDPAAANPSVGQGLNGFYWLPPMVPDPGSFTGTFDPARAPTVTITCAGATTPSCPEVARFNFGTGAGDVKVDPVGQAYGVNWKAPSNLVLGAAKYRITVTDAGNTLADALLWVVSSSTQAKALKGNELAVVSGSSFLIKFRIETGLVGGGSIEVAPAASMMAVGESVQLTAIQKNGNGEVIPGEPVSWSSSDPAIATVSAAGWIEAVAPGSVTIEAIAGTLQASAGIVVDNLAPPASALVGPDGGSLAAALSNGASLRVNVPAGAVPGPILFGLVPTLREAGARANFAFSPPGTIFGLPVEFIYSPPAGAAESGPLFITWVGAAGKGFIHLLPDGTTGNWKGVARLLGDLPVFPAVRAFSGAAFRAADAGQGAAIEGLTLDDFIAGGRVALDEFIADPTLPHARVLINTMELVAGQRGEPGFAPLGDALLTDWRAAVCARAEIETVLFASASVGPPMDIPGFVDALDHLLGLVAAAEQTQDPNLGLPWGFPGCVGGMPDYATAMNDKSAVFAARVPDLVAPAGTDFLARFDEMLDVQLPRILLLIGALEVVAISEHSDNLYDLGASIATSLRSVAWRACRENGNQAPLGRLVGFEGVAESMTDYELFSLVADLGGCTTELAWRVRPVDMEGFGPPESSGTLAPSGPGVEVPAATVTLPATSEIVIAGLVRPMVCPQGSGPGAPGILNEERLVVTARLGFTSVELASKPLRTEDPRVHLYEDSVKVTAAALREAVDATGEASIELAVDRVGNTCEGLYQGFPATSRLATLTITSEEGQCPAGAASLRAANGARGRRTAALAAECVAVSISPATTTLNLNQTRLFTPTVVGAANPAVTWSATGGTITSSGVFTGTALGDFTVRATSVEDPTVFATAAVSVVRSGGIIISPANSGTGPGRSRQYSVVVGTGPFSWGADGGSITQAGLFTAGNVEGEYAIRATSATGTGVAAVTVDWFVGIWDGTFTRQTPSVVAFPVTSYGIVRQFLTDLGCGVNQTACYATSEIDLGAINFGGCFFTRPSLSGPDVVGNCGETTTSTGGTIRATVNGDAFTATVENTFQGQVIERWSIALTRRR